MKFKFKFVKGEPVEEEVHLREDVEKEITKFDKYVEDRERAETRTENRDKRSLDEIQAGDVTIPDVSFVVERRAEIAAVRRAWRKLLPQQQELLKKIYIDERTIVNVAREEGVAPQSIHERLNRIYKRMRKILIES
ncbi:MULTISPECIES: sigma-70 family RNA polymerase sigma factor [Sporomusa]|uniref:sigma-70 family RNA polymerase sigma factor n=1 Tax=Sporomusa TaxID=2375 RepID=UPI00166D8E16|nr:MULTISPECIES: sigma-70 family RNA polymerase sigma factor [Sporomusa]MCM0759096.1 hypothetical protein [Sporomusa sphaeroides DSM 2875]